MYAQSKYYTKLPFCVQYDESDNERERERGIIQFKVLYAFDSTGMERTAYYLLDTVHNSRSK